MFNVVIENEQNYDIDPLIIKGNIDEIIQSIEEQLYNINVTYRNNVRKIKNNIKLLEGISETEFVFLEETNINDKNLIPYLSNVLEISLDCIVSTLYETNEYRTQLSQVRELKDLYKIDHPNINILKNIIKESKELFNVYSEVNDVKVSQTAFYEILDESIVNAVNRNKKISVQIPKENIIYNKVLENLDQLVDVDVTNTYNNIKRFSILQSEPLINETFIDYIKAIPGKLWGLGTTTISISASMFFLSIAAISWIFASEKKIELKDLNFTEPSFVILLTKIQNGNSLVAEEQRRIFDFMLFNSSKEDAISVAQKLFVQKLIDEHHLVNTYKDIIVQNTEQANDSINYLKDQVSALSFKITKLGDNPEQIAEAKAKLATLNETITNNQLKIVDLAKQQENLNNSISTSNTELGIMQDAIDKSREVWESFASHYIIGTTIAVGLLIVLFIFASIFIKNKTLSKYDTIKQIRAIIKLRDIIDGLKKITIINFPDLKIQFDFLNSEVKKCETTSARTSNIVMAYQCNLKYFLGSYSIILYSIFKQMVKDGTSLNGFQKLSDVHNFKGFASLTTKNLIKELNVFYNEMVIYDPTLVDSFETIFYIIKKVVIENRITDNIVKQLPDQLYSVK